MNKTRIIAIRLILSAIFAVIISRLFLNNPSVLTVIGLGVALFGFAYLFEYVRNRDKRGGA